MTALGKGKSEGAIKLICRVNIKESAMLASMEAFSAAAYYSLALASASAAALIATYLFSSVMA